MKQMDLNNKIVNPTSNTNATITVTTTTNNNNNFENLSSSFSASSSTTPFSLNEFRFHYYFAKSKFFLLCKNLKSSKRDIKLGSTLTTTKKESNEPIDNFAQQPWIWSFLKAHYEYSDQNFQKSINLLTTSLKLLPTQENKIASTVQFYNNLGCIHHKQKKTQFSNFLFFESIKRK